VNAWQPNKKNNEDVEYSTVLFQLGELVDEVADRSAQPVESPDYQSIPGTELVHELVKFWTRL